MAPPHDVRLKELDRVVARSADLTPQHKTRLQQALLTLQHDLDELAEFREGLMEAAAVGRRSKR